ncbi:MAG: hypothetical protein HGA85_05070 [Nanoarchaeota archaeon]|nr:hypothetical protein [Nanoarchaeota archaeon]
MKNGISRYYSSLSLDYSSFFSGILLIIFFSYLVAFFTSIYMGISLASLLFAISLLLIRKHVEKKLIYTFDEEGISLAALPEDKICWEELESVRHVSIPILIRSYRYSRHITYEYLILKPKSRADHLARIRVVQSKFPIPIEVKYNFPFDEYRLPIYDMTDHDDLLNEINSRLKIIHESYDTKIVSPSDPDSL